MGPRSLSALALAEAASQAVVAYGYAARLVFGGHLHSQQRFERAAQW
jgi:hypothetical protein